MALEKVDKPMHLTIVIDGESAEELFAVGPNDMRDYFLPKGLGVKKEDIKKIKFARLTHQDPDNPFNRKWIVNKENFERKN